MTFSSLFFISAGNNSLYLQKVMTAATRKEVAKKAPVVPLVVLVNNTTAAGMRKAKVILALAVILNSVQNIMCNTESLTSSKPITPAPINTILSGTRDSLRAPVEDTMVSSSTSMPGKGVTSEPVAMRMFLERTTSFSPSSFSTVTSVGLVIFP